MTDARASIHAMFPLDEAATAELDLRLNAYRAEVLCEGAALVEDKACDADFTEDPQFIAGLRTAAELLTNATEAPTTREDGAL